MKNLTVDLNEIWIPIKGFETDYKVSSEGNVKSIKKGVEKPIKPILMDRYYKVNLSKDNKVTSKHIHALVAEAFLNHKKSKTHCIDHIDNDRSNNSVSNLQIVTHRQNSSKDRKRVSRFVGVTWKKNNKKWQAAIRIGKSQHLGYYDTEEEASDAYQQKLLTLKN